ncbi:metabotropic glutamate receptor 1-like [Antedon mediterranea]|uniref:metabotropic glutamate receptor 1-like n=1 Tax=Antedon mediterranea TaxID=105859 RepID=UPI003AF78915
MFTTQRWILILLLLTVSISLVSTATYERKVAIMKGDIMFGALFSLHDPPESGSRVCGMIREQYGIQRVEATFKTLEEINNNTKILPNITLGVEIRDSCWYEQVALEQSINFISDSIQKDAEPDTKQENQNCSKRTTKPIVGVIGPGSSQVTIQIQNLLQLFSIPQIGYSASSPDLSNKKLYQYFLRVVPSDKLQARVMVDFLKEFNWTFVHAVHSDENYGTKGMDAFVEEAGEAGICVATRQKAKQSDSDDINLFTKMVQRFFEKNTTRIVVCFCQADTVRGLLKAIGKLGYKNKFLIIGGDGWADKDNVVEGLQKEANGSFTIKPKNIRIDDFDKYYMSLDPFTYKRNPWFCEFWEEKFNCSLGQCQNGTKRPNCTGHEMKKRDDYQQDTKMGYVIDAIYTLAHGLHNLQTKLCNGKPGFCEEFKKMNGSQLKAALFNVSFRSEVGPMTVSFDESGDPKDARYTIYNYRMNETGDYSYVNAGEWLNNNLRLRRPTHINPSFTGYCSEPCKRDEIKIKNDLVELAPCCWTCKPCDDDSIVVGGTCEKCDRGTWPNEDRNYCYEIEREYNKFGDVTSIIAIIFSSTGILLTTFITATFIRFHNTAIVKSSSRENSYIILSGIFMCYFTTFILVSKPSTVVCYMQRGIIGFSFSVIYSALLIRTNRMARILAGSKKRIMTRRPRFLSATAQIVMTSILVILQVSLTITFMFLEPPKGVFLYPTRHRVLLVCELDTLGMLMPLAYDVFLVAMCTLYAFKTRNLPQNFNEAKFIAFTMYTTCIIWLAFIPLYFGGPDIRPIVLCFTISLSASVALGCLFFPKTYIILCKPERNCRGNMTTSTIVRMHVGSIFDASLNSANSRKDSFRSTAGESQNGSLRKSVRRESLPILHQRTTTHKTRFLSFRRRSFSDKRLKAIDRDLALRRRVPPVYRYASLPQEDTIRTSPNETCNGDTSLKQMSKSRFKNLRPKSLEIESVMEPLHEADSERLIPKECEDCVDSETQQLQPSEENLDTNYQILDSQKLNSMDTVLENCEIYCNNNHHSLNENLSTNTHENISKHSDDLPSENKPRDRSQSVITFGNGRINRKKLKVVPRSFSQDYSSQYSNESCRQVDFSKSMPNVAALSPLDTKKLEDNVQEITQDSQKTEKELPGDDVTQCSTEDLYWSQTNQQNLELLLELDSSNV